MRHSISLVRLLCAIAFLSLPPSTGWAQSRVTLERTSKATVLLRDGQPYQVRGVGGHTHLPLLASSGGNSLRTWSDDNLPSILDAAQEHRLTVCVGLWLGHERHGFDYQDQAAVVGQLEKCLATVKKFKDHPAVLLWGIGNEMEGDGRNPAVWYAIDHIAREIKRLDPAHPTMTVIAELGDGANKLTSLERFCPHIDIVGVNSYGGIATLAERYRKAGGTKPYIVTEHGPHGPWEVEKTAWGSPIEATSTAKGDAYLNGFRQTAGQPGLCLGSYAFLWGHKQETTATWFGMLLPDGSRLAAVDAMTEAWTGKAPANRCPRIMSLTVDRQGKLPPGSALKAQVAASDPERDELKIQWILRSDAGTLGVGGDAQPEELAFSDAVSASGRSATVTLPESGGAYRLFAYVSDGKGGAAVANVPLYVDAPIKPLPAPQAQLPFVLYADGVKDSPYAPSGYMGNTKAIKMTGDSDDRPHSGPTCLKVEYLAADNWGGVLWQSPPNDWKGEKPGGLNLSGATEVEFWARGARGGEVVDFMLGVIEGDQTYRDSAKAELKSVRLTDQWQKFRIPLTGRDLSRIKTGFGWSLAGQGERVTFYLDDIRYVE